MQVIATAGHVDHGKSTLVRALTGMEPDRWEAERRRGLSIDLGFAWLTLPSGERLAFVDVPGHERFVPNMLAGVGPAPAVMFVVAADEGWMPQSAEHLAAIDALAISRGLLVVTRADLADPAPALRDAGERIRGTSLGRVDAIAVSGVTGQGLPDLRGALDRLAASLPASDPGAPVRLWVDRAFSIRGTRHRRHRHPARGHHRRPRRTAGHPVAAGRPGARHPGPQGAGRPGSSGVARVALNLRGAAPATLARGNGAGDPGCVGADRDGGCPAGRTPRPGRRGSWCCTSARRGRRPRCGCWAARPPGCLWSGPLPLHVGDRVLLRAPGAARRPRPVTAGPLARGDRRDRAGRRPAAAARPGRRGRRRARACFLARGAGRRASCCGGTAWPGSPNCGPWG